ncbi:MAG: Ldh family oxidoreductase [Nitrospirae bacterium]|nr:Ldh family oxidoreductase [Nitrospirota bacterium]
MTKTYTTIPIPEIQKTCQSILLNLTTPRTIATRVVQSLLDNEFNGYPSHGILRMVEIVSQIRGKTLHPRNRPSLTRHSQISRIIDGRYGFGTLSAEKVSSALIQVLAEESIAVIGLKNSHNLGRLANIIRSPAEKGYIILAFANYQGAGKNVLPWRGTHGRLSPNPLAIGIPRPKNCPLLVDLTTSNVPEGKIRLAALQQQRVPKGWLVDKNWLPIYDPKKLYTNPQKAFLPPLGGAFGHKGFALGLAVEVLAGIVTGAGYSQNKPSRGGNGALFIGFRPNILGQESQKVLSDIEKFIKYCRSSPSYKKESTIRIPGEINHSKNQMDHSLGSLKIHRQIWEQIINLG